MITFLKNNKSCIFFRKLAELCRLCHLENLVGKLAQSNEVLLSCRVLRCSQKSWATGRNKILASEEKEIIFTSRFQREYKYTDMEREGVAQRKNFNLK